ncbi:MAG: YheC/YheD family protein [Patescibacteria group bacterium]
MKKHKNIVVIYWSDDWEKELPMNGAPETRKSFEDWHVRGLKENIQVFRASIEWYNEKTNCFKKAWAYRDGVWEKINQPIKPDLIFDKIKGVRNYNLYDLKMKIASQVKFFNNPLFRIIVDNKFSQYLLFGEFMPKSYLANDRIELKSSVERLQTDKVVVKPLFGSGGFDIKIAEKAKVLTGRFNFPVLVQEFIRSEKGIPGLSKGKEVADLRLVFINHKLIYALSRIAKPGSLFTNFHQGAGAKLVEEKSVPASVKAMVKKIVAKLSLFSEAHYCLDFIFDNSGRPYLLEMNSTPGFDLLYLLNDEKAIKKNFSEFVKVLGV